MGGEGAKVSDENFLRMLDGYVYRGMGGPYSNRDDWAACFATPNSSLRRVASRVFFAHHIRRHCWHVYGWYQIEREERTPCELTKLFHFRRLSFVGRSCQC